MTKNLARPPKPIVGSTADKVTICVIACHLSASVTIMACAERYKRHFFFDLPAFARLMATACFTGRPDRTSSAMFF